MLFSRPNANLTERLNNLEAHLQEEHPDLVQVLPTYRKLDKVLYRLGLLKDDESLATRITWWPLISVLGTFSSGKSTFINHTLGKTLQRTGNQAVDDKFTVICYSHHESSRTLPGTALNNDPRFPFFGIGGEIEKVAEGEGRRIDTYLQLKTADSEMLKGRTLIDSPGFDADDQRRSTLRLTEHIIDISDLVLIFFDARHPEPGAMQDTLKHLVAKASGRADATKFVYILNQIDTTAREDNPEEVVAAWQRALAQTGLVSGRFLCIYNEDAAVPIADPALRERYQRKRDEDMREISRRMDEVEIERGYRVVSSLEDVARSIETDNIAVIETAVEKWRKLVLGGDVFGLVVALGLAFALVQLFGVEPFVSAFDAVKGYVLSLIAIAAAFGVVALSWHYTVRKLAAKFIAAKLPAVYGDYELNMRNAFLKNTRAWRSAFSSGVTGWGKGTRRMVGDVLGAIEGHIQRLNDLHTDPSGRKTPSVESLTESPDIVVNNEDAQIETALVADPAQQIFPSEPAEQPSRSSAE
ncbi:dynamin family protein [Magnetovibrio sp.]|uniref:dynamin family protein n=1 Tax=Magnetovibrio sp. TaxID=2024836 RepID=UPI002F9239C8